MDAHARPYLFKMISAACSWWWCWVTQPGVEESTRLFQWMRLRILLYSDASILYVDVSGSSRNPHLKGSAFFREKKKLVGHCPQSIIIMYLPIIHPKSVTKSYPSVITWFINVSASSWKRQISSSVNPLVGWLVGWFLVGKIRSSASHHFSALKENSKRFYLPFTSTVYPFSLNSVIWASVRRDIFQLIII